MSQELNIAQSTVYHWRKEFCSIETPQHTYTPKEFDAISRKLEKLEHEKEIIQLSGFLEKVPLKTKLATLEKLYKTEENPYSVYELCEALGVARGTFYNHIFRRADRSEYDREQEALMLKVQQIFDDCSQRFDAEKIRIILAESGIRVNKKRVAAIMHYIFQGQQLRDLLLYDPRFVLAQNRRMACVSQCQHQSCDHYIPKRILGAW